MQKPEDEVDETSMLVMNGPIDLKLLLNAQQLPWISKRCKDMLGLMYQIWSPTERNAYVAESISILRREIPWHEYEKKTISDEELLKMFTTTSVYSFIQKSKTFIDEDIEKLTERELEVILSVCVCFKNPKSLLKSPEKLKKILKTKSLDYLDKYQKKMLHVMKLCREMTENFMVRHLKTKGLLGLTLATERHFLFEKIDEEIEKEKIKIEDKKAWRL